MLEFHSQIRAVHVAAVSLSGALFLTRGMLVQAERTRWATTTPVRFASYAIDTVLLTAAVLLVAMLPPAMFANRWLWVKLALLVLYIALGVVALRPGVPKPARASCFAAAIVVFLTMVGIARAHHPLGWLLAWQ